jgi:hypothetical protein
MPIWAGTFSMFIYLVDSTKAIDKELSSAHLRLLGHCITNPGLASSWCSWNPCDHQTPAPLLTFWVVAVVAIYSGSTLLVFELCHLFLSSLRRARPRSQDPPQKRPSETSRWNCLEAQPSLPNHHMASMPQKLKLKLELDETCLWSNWEYHPMIHIFSRYSVDII